MQATSMFMIQAHTEYQSNRRFWLNFGVEDIFYVMGKDTLERMYFVTDNRYTPFNIYAKTGFVSMDYFWVLNYY